MLTVKLGINAKCYYGAAGSAASTEMTIVKEATINIDGESVVSGNRGSRWKSHTVGQLDCTLELKVTAKTSDGGYRALNDSWLNATTLALKALDKVSGEGIDGDFQVEKRSESQPLNGEIEITFTCGLSTKDREPSWITGS